MSQDWRRSVPGQAANRPEVKWRLTQRIVRQLAVSTDSRFRREELKGLAADSAEDFEDEYWEDATSQDDYRKKMNQNFMSLRNTVLEELNSTCAQLDKGRSRRSAHRSSPNTISRTTFTPFSIGSRPRLCSIRE